MKSKKSLLFVLILFIISFSLFISPASAQENLDASEEIVAETTKYFKTVTVISNSSMMVNANQGEVSSITTEITEEEFDNAPSEDEATTTPQDTIDGVTISTNYKKLTSRISRPNSDQFIYKAILYWKKMPKVRSYDIIGVGFYGSVKVFGTVDFVNEYCDDDNNCDDYQGYYEYVDDNGAGAVFSLPTGDLSYLQQTLTAIIEKRNPDSTIISQACVADYAHATSTISYSNAKKFFINTGGITHLDGTSSYYDTIPYAQSEWSGTW